MSQDLSRSRLHDWSRVTAGVYHAFHNSWITHLQEALNGGRLPPDYYALGEQKTGPYGPDVLTLQSVGPADELPEPGSSPFDSPEIPGGGPSMALAESPPPRFRINKTPRAKRSTTSAVNDR